MRSSKFASPAPWAARAVRLLVPILVAEVLGLWEPAVAQQAPGDIPAKVVELQVGQQVVLDAQGVKSFSEGLPGIVDVRLTRDNSQFVVVGKRHGDTTLLLLMLDGQVRSFHMVVRGEEQSTETVPFDHVEARDNVRLDFYFVQVSADDSSRLGIGWPTSISSSVGASMAVDLETGMVTGASAVVSAEVLPQLDMAQADGWAKVLRKAALITENGKQANFSSGGEVNISVSGGFGGSIQQVHYGSQVAVMPLYDKESGRIALHVEADVSDLTADNGTGVPGRTVSKVDAVVNLELGQALMLAGLSAHNERSGRSGLPWLSRIPILGALFGTHTAGASQTENVVFILPTVIDTVGREDRRRIADALESYQRFAGDFDELQLRVPSEVESHVRR